MIQVASFLGCINKVFEGVDGVYLMTLCGALRGKALSHGRGMFSLSGTISQHRSPSARARSDAVQ